MSEREAMANDPRPPDGRELVRSSRRVRVGFMTGDAVQAEGVMIGYYDHPTYVIREDDGTQVTVSSYCPMTVLPTPKDPAPPSG